MKTNFIKKRLSVKKERKEFFRMVAEIRAGIKPAKAGQIDKEIEEACNAVKKKRSTMSELSDRLDSVPDLGDDRKRFKKDLKELRRKQPQMPKGS